jgi:predicted  nucleic acid-binding Zn-ribbon protein
MEVDARLGIQLAIMLATIAGGYSVVKNQLSRVIEDLEKHVKQFEDHKSKFDTRLDDAESERTLFAQQIKTLSGISSPQELKSINREMGEFGARLKMAEKQVDKLDALHNGKHPPVAG